MSSTAPQKLPFWAILQDQSAVDSQARLNQAGRYDLSESEQKWVARQPALHARGYSLRTRYIPGWQPSWIGTNRRALYCEDSICTIIPSVMDATRQEDGQLVAIKTVSESQELKIAQFLTSLDEPRNHCVSVLDVFPDSLEPGITLMVMPYLRPYNNPPMATIGELFAFIDQTLEGLSFLHSHRVAHRDVAPSNIMMDASALFPEGHHPVRLQATPDAVYDAKYHPRTGRPVRYLYIDFDCATVFDDGKPSMVLGVIGRDREVPELSDLVPYDAFKVDIYALGNMYFKEFFITHKHMEFLQPMIDHMKQHDPSARPSIEEVIRQWGAIRSNNKSRSSWRLALKTETSVSRLVEGIQNVAMNGLESVLTYLT
ncbi:kinase-like domain-containing protein [Epithele typhae]|uniref:kinase-like domain-containing protein n=1 Tax=Epithele typhae TaxID=378194 RepID=UPI0020079DB7|nr:kinase-like domain-containing protein [Epithele typhae]KAH9935121.1 kinase-like domain-containing protein [Epithele typhae]